MPMKLSNCSYRWMVHNVVVFKVCMTVAIQLCTFRNPSLVLSHAETTEVEVDLTTSGLNRVHCFCKCFLSKSCVWLQVRPYQCFKFSY